MALQTPLFLQQAGADPAVTYSATNYRLSLIAALYQVAGVVDPYGSGGLLVSQRGAGANFSVDVASGYAVVLGGDVVNQGSYLVFNDAVVNVVTPVAPGSGTRIHRLVLQIRDKLNNGVYTTYDGQLQLLQDTGSGTPATPASAVSLATISIAAGQASVANANITDTRTWARAASSYTGLLTVNTTNHTTPDATRLPRYRLTPDGYVHLSGYLSSSGAIVANYSPPTLMLSGLPKAAIPSGNRDMNLVYSRGAAACQVQTNGSIYWYPTPSPGYTTTAGDWWSLDGISYRVAS